MLLFIPLIVLAGVACPLHMWWHQRQRRQAACRPPRRPSQENGLEDLGAPRARHTTITAQIRKLEPPPKATPNARSGAPLA